MLSAAVRHTVKSNLLNEIELKDACYHFIGNPHFGVTVTNFMAILQSIDYSMFERFSNAGD